jgi:hypothetical protein
VKALVLALTAFCFFGCRTGRVEPEIMNVRNGLLLIGQHRDWFLQEWGAPTKTFAEYIQGNAFEAIRSGSSSEKAAQAGVTDTAQAVQKENQERFAIKEGRGRNCEIWVYDSKGVTLIFDRRDLVAWRYHDGSKPR